MSRGDNGSTSMWLRRTPRRAVLRGAVYGGGGLTAAVLAACGGGSNNGKSATSVARPAATGGAPAAAGTVPSRGATAAANAPGGAPAKLADKIVLPWPFFPREYDAHTALGPEIWHVIGSRPIRRNARTGELIGEVAQSWEIADPQGTQIVIKVRPDVRTHDKAPTNGRLFTAEDFAYNLMRISGALDPTNKARYQRASTLTGMDSAQAVDATTVQLKMSKPNSGLFNGLAEFRNMLMPKDTVESVGFSNPAALSGTGPFVVQEFEDYKAARFTRHPNYYVKGQPHFQELTHLTTTDPSANISAFLSKQIAMLAASRLQTKDAIEAGRKDARFVQNPGLNWWHVRFNVQRAPWSDPRVRKAFALVIDREALAKARWGSLQWSLTGPIEPAFPEGLKPDELKTYPGFNSPTKPEDIANAKALLTQAGVGKLDVKILPGSATPTDEWFENAVRVKDQLEKALDTVKVTVTPPADTAAFAKQQADGEFDLISYTITTLPDPVLELISQYQTGGSRNYGKFSNPETDSLIDKALATLDNKARAAILRDFQDKFLKEWLPAVQFYVNPDAGFIDPHYAPENEEQVIGPWNPARVGYGEQSIQYWMQV